MISININYRLDFVGLSTDTKPTAQVEDGSTFYTVDTQELYVYCKGNWYLQAPIETSSEQENNTKTQEIKEAEAKEAEAKEAEVKEAEVKEAEVKEPVEEIKEPIEEKEDEIKEPEEKKETVPEVKTGEEK